MIHIGGARGWRRATTSERAHGVRTAQSRGATANARARMASIGRAFGQRSRCVLTMELQTGGTYTHLFRFRSSCSSRVEVDTQSAGFSLLTFTLHHAYPCVEESEGHRIHTWHAHRRTHNARKYAANLALFCIHAKACAGECPRKVVWLQVMPRGPDLDTARRPLPRPGRCRARP